MTGAQSTAPDRFETAHAKVNLYLHVTGKREDGYHLLDSLAVFAGIADRIEYEPSDTFSLAVTGPFAASLKDEPNNLISRAAFALADACGMRATGALTLEKRIPVASGIGGGSADAAATLRLLCRVWGVNPGDAVLQGIALRLGADIPVCLGNRPMRMRGVGEKLTPAPSMPDCGLALINPGAALSTVSVFRARTAGAYSAEATLPGEWKTPGDMAKALSAMTNDLEVAAIGLAPTIRDVLHALSDTPDCLLARMSGSGATCFGLFPDARGAENAAKHLARPGWWTWGGTLGE